MTTLFDYPEFASSQTLRSDDLNDLREYLANHSQLIRKGMIGAGILCGLEMEIIGEDDKSLIVSRGVGLSSDGNVFVAESNLVYRSFKVLTDAKKKLLKATALCDQIPGAICYEFSAKEYNV